MRNNYFVRKIVCALSLFLKKLLSLILILDPLIVTYLAQPYNKQSPADAVFSAQLIPICIGLPCKKFYVWIFKKKLFKKKVFFFKNMTFKTLSFYSYYQYFLVSIFEFCAI